MIEPGLWDMVMRLRQRGISNAGVMRALETVPRSRFCDPAKAYDESALPLPCGQSTLPPLLAAQMLQLAEIRPDTKVLVVGLGSGWVAGLAASMSRRVFGVERYQSLLLLAERNLASAGLAITTRWGDGSRGWPAQAPFDVVLLCAEVEQVPKALQTQTATTGRIVAVVGGTLGTWSRSAKSEWAPVLPAGTDPLLPGKSKAL